MNHKGGRTQEACRLIPRLESAIPVPRPPKPDPENNADLQAIAAKVAGIMAANKADKPKKTVDPRAEEDAK